MKRFVVLASFLFFANFCCGQGFDKEMVVAGKKFHKNSDKACRASESSRKKYSNSEGNSQKRNRARRKSMHARR
jgi:hypothetical protein